MKLIKHEEFNRKLKEGFNYKFEIEKEGFYLIEISARARSEKQIDQNGTDDDDLRIEIDGRKFPKLENPERYFDSPASFSGGQLHNLKKTVYFLIFFSEGKHFLDFIPDKTPVLENLSVYFVSVRHSVSNTVSNISLNVEQTAENGNRRPWITFALVDLSLNEFETKIETERRFLDSDDVKLIINGKIKRNLREGIFRKFWFWAGSFLKGETKTENFNANLNAGLHYVEFHADRTPKFHNIEFDFGEQVKRIPNVYDPEWTGNNFKDDTEQMILARAIFGEARNLLLSDKVRIAVGWSIRNRVENNKRWGDTYKEVILEPVQYSAFNLYDENRPFVEDPFREEKQQNKKSWKKCYKIAGQVMNGEVQDPIDGANHYYDESIDRPDWLTEENFIIKIDTIFFHRL